LLMIKRLTNVPDLLGFRFIMSGYRGRGISKHLLATVIEHAKSNFDHSLHFGTRITLESAITLYRNSGFSEILRDGLYIEMEKVL
jgi:GNAT superfamily N-acetyltransferase